MRYLHRPSPTGFTGYSLGNCLPVQPFNRFRTVSNLRTFPTREAADKMFDDRVRAAVAGKDANDMLYYFDASRDYDPAPQLERIIAPLVAINSADDQVNPPELGIAEREIKRVKRGRFILLPITDQTRGHGTHSLPELWQHHLAALLKETERP